MPGLMVWLMFSTALPTPLPRYLQVHMLGSMLAYSLDSVVILKKGVGHSPKLKTLASPRMK